VPLFGTEQDDAMVSADLLIQSLRRQPLLVVLRPATPLAAEPQL
jgi:hypothetical protein